MTITDVTIRLLPPEANHGRLRGYATIIFDHLYAVHDLKVIQGVERLFVAMPSRRLTVRCEQCQTCNLLTRPDQDCVKCAAALNLPARVQGDDPHSIFADIFHPIHPQGRAEIDAAVLHAYQQALQEQLLEA